MSEPSDDQQMMDNKKLITSSTMILPSLVKGAYAPVQKICFHFFKFLLLSVDNNNETV